MKTNDLYVTVHYEGNEYRFDNGAEAFIFYTGISNHFQKSHGMKGLLRYVAIVHECYIKDDVGTPLGALADYVAKYWKEAKKVSPRTILRGFYNSVALEVA